MMVEKNPDYFLISVSNRTNLNLCMKHGLAGFTNSINGLWTFVDVEVGDYISFLYGARARNLYRVVEKIAYNNSENLPPWPPVTFKMSGNTYHFPYRLVLEPERILNEPMIRPEFAYVAENLLLRGGYRKTHFQADTITFHHVSNMGKRFTGEIDSLYNIDAETFTPKIVFRREMQRIPETFYFRELILQSLLRKKLKEHRVLRNIIEHFGLNNTPNEFEVLGEKALPEGFVDIFIKLRHPVAKNTYILVEVKTKRATKKDFEQLRGYLSEFGGEAAGGLLIAADFPKRLPQVQGIFPVKYRFDAVDYAGEYAYESLYNALEVEFIE